MKTVLLTLGTLTLAHLAIGMEKPSNWPWGSSITETISWHALPCEVPATAKQHEQFAQNKKITPETPLIFKAIIERSETENVKKQYTKAAFLYLGSAQCIKETISQKTAQFTIIKVPASSYEIIAAAELEEKFTNDMRLRNLQKSDCAYQDEIKEPRFINIRQ